MASNKRKIGAVIALDGESAFKKSVSACNASLKTMKSEMALVNQQFKGQARLDGCAPSKTRCSRKDS